MADLYDILLAKKLAGGGGGGGGAGEIMVDLQRHVEVTATSAQQIEKNIAVVSDESVVNEPILVGVIERTAKENNYHFRNIFLFTNESDSCTYSGGACAYIDSGGVLRVSTIASQEANQNGLYLTAALNFLTGKKIQFTLKGKYSASSSMTINGDYRIRVFALR